MPKTTVIAVVDTGVDATHPLLDGAVLPGIACTGEGEGICDGDDAGDASESGHGTSVTALTAGLAKLAAPQAQIRVLPVAVGDEDREERLDRLAAGVRAAAQWEGSGGEKVGVILIGLGQRYPGLPFRLSEAVEEARQAGIPILAPAGNDGNPIVMEDEEIGSYYPAALPGVTAVGGYDRLGRPISNSGASLLLPGEALFTASIGGDYAENSGSEYAAALSAAGAAIIRAYSETPAEEALTGGMLSGTWSLKRALETAFPDPNDKTAPAWPDGAQMTPIGIGYASVKLDWPLAQDDSGSVRYEVTQAGVKLPGNYLPGQTFGGLKPGTAYAFAVAPVDRSGNRGLPLGVSIETKAVSPIERITAAADGASPNGDSEFASVSDDGNLIAFESEASNLVAGDGNGEADIFVRDRAAGTTRLISRSSSGGDSDGGSYAPLISGDGAYVLFTSHASNLVKGLEAGETEDLYLANLRTGAIERVAENVMAGYIYNTARPYAMSDGARYIAFSSYAANGTANDYNGTWDVFVKDRTTQTVTRITDRLPDFFNSSQLDITPNGRYVTFAINQIGLLQEDINIDDDIYVYDTLYGEYELISHNPQGLSGSNSSRNPSISDDGRYVTFESFAGDLSDEDQDYTNDVYVYDRKTRSLKLANYTVDGQASGGENVLASMSGSGRFVAFESDDSLDPSAVNRSVYIRDLKRGMTYWMGQSPTGESANADVQRPSISDDGSRLVFQSRAWNLVPGQEEGAGYTEIYYATSPVELDNEAPVWEDGAELKVAQYGSTYAALQWPQPKSSSGAPPAYRIYRNGELVGSTTEPSFLVTNLKPGASYAFKVVAGSVDHKWGSQALATNLTTLAEAETDAPSGVSDASLSIQPGQVAVSWTDPADLDFMYVQVLWRKLGAPDDKTNATRMLPKGKQKALITNLVNGTTYQFAFAVYDAEGNKRVYSADSVTMGAGPRIARVAGSDTDGDNMSGYGGIQISADGRYAVFESTSPRLAEGDTNGGFDVFLYDYVDGTVQLISRDELGMPGDGQSMKPDISGDGRFIVFQSDAQNLMGAVSSGTDTQIFVMDRDADGNGKFDEPGGVTLKRISESPMGDPANNHSELPSISADGKTIVFISRADNLSGVKTNQTEQLYIYDNGSREGGLTLLLNAEGKLPNASMSEPDVSGDGKTIVFGTNATNLAPDTNESEDAYLYDVATKTFTPLTHFENDNPFYYNDVSQPTVSMDGKRVAFAYHGYEFSGFDIYVYDRGGDAPTVRRITDKPNEELYYINSKQPSISPDGRYVAFSSDLPNLVAGDKNGNTDIFLYDLQENKARLVSRAFNGEQGNGSSYNPAVSEGGKVVAFRSVAENLVTGDFNGVDLFVTETDEETGEGELAALAAELLGDGKVKLTWSAPSAAGDIAAYEVVRTGSNQMPVTIATLDADQHTYTDQPDMQDVFSYQIIAVDRQGAKRPYSESKVIRVTDLVIRTVSYHTPLMQNRYAAVGGRIAVSATGTSEAAAAAVLTYRYGAESRTAEVALTERTAGGYEGALTVPEGASELIALQIVLAKDGNEVAKSALTGSIRVGGAMRFTFDTPHGELLKDAYLSVSSAAMKARAGLKLSGGGEVVLNGLPQASDYRISLVTDSGLELLAKPGDRMYTVTWGSEEKLNLVPGFESTLLTRIIGPDGNALPNIDVTIWDEASVVLRTGQSSAQGTISLLKGRYSGEKLSVEANDASREYLWQSKDITLSPGTNEIVLALDERPTAKVSGKVAYADGRPAVKADVTLIQTVDGSPLTKTVKTDASGSYAADVFAGELKLLAAVAKFGRSQAKSLTLASGASPTVDLELQEGEPTSVRINLYTKHLGAEWVGPLELDWRTIAHYHFTVPTHTVLSSGNPMMIKASPGDEVRVCARGVESRLPDACGTAKVGENGTTELEIRMEDLGTRFKGELLAKFAPDQGWPAMNLFRLDAQGKRQLVLESAIKARAFEFTLPSEGRYVAQIKTGGRIVEREFEARRGEPSDLGKIALPEKTFYGGQSGNGLTLTPGSVALDTDFQVRATFRNQGEAVTDQTKMRFMLPQGVSYVPASGALNGQITIPNLGDGYVEFSLGQVAKGEAGVLVFRLKLSKSMNAASVVLASEMSFAASRQNVSEVVARAAAEVSSVTLDAPDVTGRRDIKLSGIAKSNSTVRIYEGESLLGETRATSAGTWKLPVNLPDRGEEATYRIFAESDDGTVKTPSDIKRIRVSKAYPQMTKFSMRQVDGREVTFDPGDGVAKFPYVFAPHLPFIFKISFNNPDAVKNVKVFSGSESAIAERGDDGVFTAVLQTSNPDGISVSYEAQEVFTVPPQPQTDEEYREQLPPDVQDFVKEDLQLNTASATVHTATMKGSVPVEGGKVGMSMNYRLERIENYTPPAADRSGSPVRGLRFNYSLSNNQLNVSMTAYIPESEFASLGVEGAIAKMSSAMSGDKNAERSLSAFSGAGAAIKIAVQNAMKWEGAGKVWTSIDTPYSIFDGLGVNDSLKELGDIALSAGGCSPGVAQQYADEANDIAKLAMAYELAKWSMMLGSLVAGPATFGWGTVGLWMLTNGIGKVMDAHIGAKVDDLKARVANDEDCRDDEDDDEDDNDDDNDDRDDDRDDSEDVADPVWIYDPSGYVYEVTEARRVQGVKATVMYKDETTGEWKVWDADWFGQVNPQFTDTAGRYGWDVPRGLWKVVYEKEGFVTAESSELPVPPPHFDVNIPLVSVLPATMTDAYAQAGGSAIDLVFDRHVRLDTIEAGGIAVMAEGDGGQPLEGLFTAVDETDWKGIKVARHIRFTPATALQAGAVYTVAASSAVLSYNNIPSGADTNKQVTVSAADTTAPMAVTNPAAFAERRALLLTWEDPADIDFKQVELTWKPRGGKDPAQTVAIAKGQQWARLSGLETGTEYQIAFRSIDETGNAAETIMMKTTIAADETAPDTVGPLDVTNVSATPGRDKLTLTWTDPTATDLANVQITWREAGTEAVQGPVTVAKGEQTYTIADLKSGTAYEMMLTAFDEAGNGSFGITETAQTKGEINEVTNVKAEPSLDKLKLTWTDPTFADLKHIRITWREEGAAAEQGTATVEKGAQTHTITGLKSGTKYEVTLIALDNDGNTSTGVNVTAQTKQAP
ncbi:fibronectin type III domain-containing protein, partial [Paenibacillus xanthanilyticus]